MIPPRLLDALCIPSLILRAASLLLASHHRSEWFAEWHAELWHITKGRDPKARQSPQDAIAFSLGAFQDALWLRRNHPRPSQPRFALGSASRCAMSLAIWASAALLLCLLLPETRKVVSPSPYANKIDLVMISSDGFTGAQTPAIRFADYRAWKASTRHLFTELAFYQPIQKRVRLAPHNAPQLSLMRASSNLFPLLSIPPLALAPGQIQRQEHTRLVLSESAWRSYFHADPQIIGHQVEIGGQQILITGVIPADAWRLPGQVDAWLLEDEQHVDSIPSNSQGFVLARIKPSGFPPRSGEWHYITVRRPDGDPQRFDCVPLREETRQPLLLFLFALLVACLALPATTPLPLGEYPASAAGQTWKIRARRWIFLAAKFAVIVPGVYFTSLALSYGIHFAVHVPDALLSQYLELSSSFFGLLFAFRWALRDQRQRCPVCLRVLTNPAHVGETSRNFLAWNGTELICAGGHGLLHIPELPTSWFSTQRWLYLDPSWSSLFADAYLPSNG